MERSRQHTRPATRKPVNAVRTGGKAWRALPTRVAVPSQRDEAVVFVTNASFAMTCTRERLEAVLRTSGARDVILLLDGEWPAHVPRPRELTAIVSQRQHTTLLAENRGLGSFGDLRSGVNPARPASRRGIHLPSLPPCTPSPGSVHAVRDGHTLLLRDTCGRVCSLARV